jgi:hypothetical protein
MKGGANCDAAIAGTRSGCVAAFNLVSEPDFALLLRQRQGGDLFQYRLRDLEQFGHQLLIHIEYIAVLGRVATLVRPNSWPAYRPNSFSRSVSRESP